MAESIDAGALDQRLELLELAETSPGVFEWTTTCRTWGRVTTGKNAVFAPHAASAPGVEVVIRRRALDLHHALRWRDCTGKTWHLLPVSLAPYGMTYTAVKAALVDMVQVRQVGDETTVEIVCPGVISEQYVRHEQQWPMSVNDIRQVLSIPKLVRLSPGALVEIGEQLFEVVIPHETEPFCNEYEIEVRRDL